MLETGVLVGTSGQILAWHLPPGRTSGYLPDSRNLWEILWEHRKGLYGFAHSHPGSGPVAPSNEDLTTFSAVDRALGQRLVWPISSEDHVAFFTWKGPGPYDYAHAGQFNADDAPDWMPAEWLLKLRELSNYNK